MYWSVYARSAMPAFCAPAIVWSSTSVKFIDLLHRVAEQVLQRAAQHVDADERPEVADVAARVHRQAAGVHADGVVARRARTAPPAASGCCRGACMQSRRRQRSRTPDACRPSTATSIAQPLASRRTVTSSCAPVAVATAAPARDASTERRDSVSACRRRSADVPQRRAQPSIAQHRHVAAIAPDSVERESRSR